MEKLLRYISKITCMILVLAFALTLVACGDDENKNVLVTEIKIEANLEMKPSEYQKIAVTILPENASNKDYEITSSDENIISVVDDKYLASAAIGTCTITVKAKDGSNVSQSINIEVKNNVPVIVETEINVGIKGSTEVKSGKSIKLDYTVSTKNANVAIDKTCKWSIVKGNEYAEISEDGTLTTKDVDGDKLVEVRATSNENSKYYGSKVITIVSKPVLTDDMLEPFRYEKVSFEGYVNIDLYTIGLFEKLYKSQVLAVKTSMDGTNWYAEYVSGDSDTRMGLYFKNHNNLACQVGLSLMNDELYTPMKNSNEESVSWHDAGLYNSLADLKVSDFKFNDETWRYEYIGNDESLLKRIAASANPYDYDPKSLGLIIEEGEVMGIYMDSKDDFALVSGYKALQQLVVVIDHSDTVKVPSINKYPHKDFQDELQVAINNMRNLKSYKLDFRQLTNNTIISGTRYTEGGFEETITNNMCFFRPYGITYDNKGNEVKNYVDDGCYGFKKINDNLYNSFYETEDDVFNATRAYEKDFSNAKPSFEFAAEIFAECVEDKKAGTKTYYSYELMKTVASTFYYGVGNDINLYGIFAQQAYLSSSSFTPFVVVKDGYIVESCFYFYLGSLFGIVTISYSDFDKAEIDENVKVEFETRQVPTSWSDVNIEVSPEGSTSTTEDISVVASEYLKEFFKDEEMAKKLPFFGNCLGDTYGFGMITIHRPANSQVTETSLLFYYDVPLDIDYTINSSMNKLKEFLKEQGFVDNGHGEYYKDGIYIAPVDSQLDFNIYVWKDRNYTNSQE